MWHSQAAHLLWEQGVGGSNPPIPTWHSFGDLRKRRSPAVLGLPETLLVAILVAKLCFHGSMPLRHY